ncbi:hypothetical protein IWX91DRAFT_178021 [Phyllosticta citricarpa]
MSASAMIWQAMALLAHTSSPRLNAAVHCPVSSPTALSSFTCIRGREGNASHRKSHHNQQPSNQIAGVASH